VAVRPNPVRIDPRDAELLLEHRAYVHKLCRILLRDSDESEDAAQQALLNAHRALADGVRPLDGRAWLAEIARNECRSRVRRAAARPEAPLPDALPAAGSDPAELAARKDLLARLRDELAELPERQRRAVLLREFRGLSYDELATEMAETGPAVESLLQRARRRLTRRLVPAALVLDWARGMLARIGIGPAASETAATGAAAALVAKLAAAGVVAVGVTAGGADLQGPPPRPPRGAAPVAPVAREPVRAIAPTRAARPVSSRRTGRSDEREPSPSRSSGSSRHDDGGDRISSPSEGPGPAAPAPAAPAPPAPEPTPVEPGSSSSGPGPGPTETGHEAEPIATTESPAVEAAETETHGGGGEPSSSGESGSGPGPSGSGSDDSALRDGSGRDGSGSSGSGR
jgi:RNA polymerase sigma factor (sigma-70 family)